ncbi:hypothetical protein [Maricaulis virginensis]|uniref:Replication initiation factor n=1 Tax=Maricaulis virginensis TaxID=144022 RepID=A0A9W6MMI9_9PROT|nr:hypothetical protein [Maricaulis virginensis]GLK50879.1 hypothetical protein GCM10017621_03870 [Maricaulis virginensis]
MTEPLLLHSGFDNLDMAYRVTLPQSLHTSLLAAKAEALEARRAIPLTFGGQTFLVNGHGGTGGYAFSVDTGIMGANWWFKEPGTRDPWGARVSSRALPLAIKGIEAVKADLDRFLIALGMTFSEIDRRLSRIDYALDFLLPEFSIDPSQFVCHSQKKKSINGEYAANYCGDRVSYIRIGTAANSEVVVYDKRREVIDTKKRYWWDLWKEKADKAETVLSKNSPIWRFEFRAGKNFLEKTYRRKTWEAFASAPNMAFQKIAAQTRLTVPQPDINRARWPSAVIWQTCQTRLAAIELAYTSNVDVEAIKQALWSEYLCTIGSQTTGLILSQMCAFGLGEDDIPAMLEQIGFDLKDALNRCGDSPAEIFRKRRCATRAKYG